MSQMRLSSDGLVHISIDELLSLRINHLVSGIDYCEGSPKDACGHETVITGHTEWMGHCDTSITIGWDWSFHGESNIFRWHRIGMPRTNVVLVDDFGNDKPWERNLEHIASVVDSLSWAKEVASVTGITLY